MELIIAAIIAAAGGIVGGVLANEETKKASQEARKLANIRRDDELKMFDENQKLSKEQD